MFSVLAEAVSECVVHVRAAAAASCHWVQSVGTRVTLIDDKLGIFVKHTMNLESMNE